MKLDLNTDILLSRMSTGEFRLTITDKTSRIIILEATLDASQFADMLSARNANDVPVKLIVSEKHGKEHQVKDVMLQNVSNGDELDAARDAWELANSSDGWVLDKSENFNHHRYDHKTKTYRTLARRWV